jgi:hypothetical protein
MNEEDAVKYIGNKSPTPVMDHIFLGEQTKEKAFRGGQNFLCVLPVQEQSGAEPFYYAVNKEESVHDVDEEQLRPLKSRSACAVSGT